MQSNPGPRPAVGSHSAIETVISGAYARDEKRVLPLPMRRASRRLVASWPAPVRHRRAIPKTGNGRSGGRSNTGPTRFAPPASVSGYSPLRFWMSRRR